MCINRQKQQSESYFTEIQMSIRIPDKQTRCEGGKEKLPERT